METTQYDRAFFISVGHGRSLSKMFEKRYEMPAFFSEQMLIAFSMGTRPQIFSPNMFLKTRRNARFLYQKFHTSVRHRVF